MESNKLFKVTKYNNPEWGRSEIVFVKYFVASQKKTVEEVMMARHGSLKHWYAYDRCEEVIEIEEVNVEFL